MTNSENNSINNNYAWFKENLSELVKAYNNQYVVIKDAKVIAAYPAFDAAFDETLKTEKMGTFIIQFCSVDESKMIRRFRSRARVSA
jgi:hypothetical protein